MTTTSLYIAYKTATKMVKYCLLHTLKLYNFLTVKHFKDGDFSIGHNHCIRKEFHSIVICLFADKMAYS